MIINTSFHATPFHSAHPNTQPDFPSSSLSTSYLLPLFFLPTLQGYLSEDNEGPVARRTALSRLPGA